MVYVLYTFLAIVAFLGVLNGFLRGAWKKKIDISLSVILIGLLIAIGVVGGWKNGLLATVIVFFIMIIFRPFAARAASWLFAGGSGTPRRSTGLPSMTLEKISRQLANEVLRPKNVEDLFSENENVGEEALLNYCESTETVQEAMREFSISREELRGIYHDLLGIGAGQWILGHWLAASALAYPDALRYVLKSKKSGQFGLATFSDIFDHFEKGIPLS